MYVGIVPLKHCHCLCTQASWGVRKRMLDRHVRLKYVHCMCTQALESFRLKYPSDGGLHRGGGFRDVHKPFFDANLNQKIRVSIVVLYAP